MNRRTFANLLAAGLVLPPITASVAYGRPEATIPDQSQTGRTGTLCTRSREGIREYRILWSDGTWEPVTSEEFLAMPGRSGYDIARPC